MAIEKFWPAVAPQLFTADGTSLGVVTIGSTAGFKVKQTVTIQSTSPAQEIQVQIKRAISSTQFIVGPLAQSLQPAFKQQGNQLLSVRQDISAYTVASGAFVYAAEQPKLPIDPKDIIQAVYRQEPGTTIGVELDDQFGNPIDTVTGADGKNRLAVDAEVSVDLKTIGLFNMPYDTVGVTYPSSVVENYQSYLGGLAGTPVQLVVVTYTDNTKNSITSVVRTPSGP